MQEYRNEELERRAAAELEKERSTLLEKIGARQTIRNEIEAMVQEGAAHFLTDEECALLHNFRRFKSGLNKNKRGTFQFKTWPDDRAIIPGNEVSLIERQ